MKEIIDRLGGKYVIMGHLTFVVLLIYSVLFYKERVLHMDSAYQVFQNLNFGMLINDGRYSMFLSQLLPLLMVKLHAPLLLVLCSYSVSFVLIMYAFFLATVYLAGDKLVGLLMALTVFCVNNTFYHCISETFQLMMFAPFLFAWLNHKVQPTLAGNAIYYAVLSFAMFMCVFIMNSEPVMMPMLVSRCTLWCMAAPDTPHSRATSRKGVRAFFEIIDRIFLSSSSMLWFSLIVKSL